jgi:hypothetical protein
MLLEVNKDAFNLELNHLVNVRFEEHDSKVATVITFTFLKHQHQTKDHPFLIKECRSIFVD